MPFSAGMWDGSIEQRALRRLAQQGRATEIQAFVQTTRRFSHLSALEIAVRNDHAAAVRVLASADGNNWRVNGTNGYSIKLMQIAAYHGSANATCVLADLKADVHVGRWARAAPMQVAALKGHVEVLRALLLAKVSVDTVGCDGATPVATAARSGNTAAVRLLLRAKADADRTSVVSDGGRWPPTSRLGAITWTRCGCFCRQRRMRAGAHSTSLRPPTSRPRAAT